MTGKVANDTTGVRQQRGREARAAGYIAEEQVAHWLAERGVQIVARNVRCKGGEIDLVIDDHGTLGFVEVRQRSNSKFGGAAASITARKQQRIALAAQFFLLRHPRLADRPCRFDAVVIDGASAPDWIKDAFRL